MSKNMFWHFYHLIFLTFYIVIKCKQIAISQWVLSRHGKQILLTYFFIPWCTDTLGDCHFLRCWKVQNEGINLFIFLIWQFHVNFFQLILGNNDGGGDENHDQQPNNNDEAATEAVAAAIVEDQRPHFLNVMATFVTTFFTSLLPNDQPIL